MRLVPPVAVPFGVTRIFLAALRRSAAGEAGFAEMLASRIGARGATLFGSGRAAVAAALRSLANEGRDEVVVPAYTCWSVPAAVVRCGLRVRLADVDPMTLDYERSSLLAQPTGRMSAAIGAHLFARTSDLTWLVDYFRKHDPRVRVIEDAAQAWPDRSSREVSAVVLSFGRGKPLPLGGGGALVRFGGDGAPASAVRGGGWSGALSLAATSVLQIPALFGLLEPLPFLEIGSTAYDPEFPADAPFRAWQDRLGRSVLAELEALTETRTRNASALAQAVESSRRWRLPAAARMPGPLRLPALAPSRPARDEVIARLRRLGVGASAMYPGTLADIPALREHLANPDEPIPGANALADTLLTLPCHPGLGSRGLIRVRESFERASRDVGA
ncbi:MAG: DegT/DnrJ/EryC1/StrS family aminotransferase [Acidobacteriia bacterium]|nr:DegT/DnrJ/EryC1/StrS family aminotransferase [Terriglobia bacterium]